MIRQLMIKNTFGMDQVELEKNNGASL